MSTDSHENPGHSTCCHEHGEHAHSVTPAQAAKYFCPMCDGVVSDKPGACPMCGMALERNPAYVPSRGAVYTCPMHPEIRQDHPARARFAAWRWSRHRPARALRTTTTPNWRDMTRRFWIGLALTVPVLVLSMGEFVPGLREVMASLRPHHW